MDDRAEVPRQQRTFSLSEVRQMGRITVETLQKMFADGAQLIIEKEPYLTEIDSVIGDGDHGTGMKRGGFRGCRAACREVIFLCG